MAKSTVLEKAHKYASAAAEFAKQTAMPNSPTGLIGLHSDAADAHLKAANAFKLADDTHKCDFHQNQAIYHNDVASKIKE